MVDKVVAMFVLQCLQEFADIEDRCVVMEMVEGSIKIGLYDYDAESVVAKRVADLLQWLGASTDTLNAIDEHLADPIGLCDACGETAPLMSAFAQSGLEAEICAWGCEE